MEKQVCYWAGVQEENEALKLDIAGLTSEITLLRDKNIQLEEMLKLQDKKEVYSVPRTGQENSFMPGDDGDKSKGMIWPTPRFTDNSDGTVTDNLTNLVWLKNLTSLDSVPWKVAITTCNNLKSGNAYLSDNSKVGDWRLPNVNELFSLVDFSTTFPPLAEHPFISVYLFYFWTSTTNTVNNSYAFSVNMVDGQLSGRRKDGQNSRFWPVRN